MKNLPLDSQTTYGAKNLDLQSFDMYLYEVFDRFQKFSFLDSGGRIKVEKVAKINDFAQISPL